jgi:RNA polymerase sigma factor (TIGR02999 family)
VAVMFSRRPTLPEMSETAEKLEKRTTDSMIPSIYAELRQLAAKKLATEAPGQTLSATALVHEAYLALSRIDEPQWDNRGHFYVAAAEAMRRILIGRARRKNAAKRGGGVTPEPLAEDSIIAPSVPDRDDELIAIDDALVKFAKDHERKARLVNLRYFVGLTIDEAAEVLGISKATAKRDWVFARAWLERELTQGAS